jgi:hypothetical protein
MDNISCITSSATWWRRDTDDTSGIALNNAALDNENQQDDSIIAIDRITYSRNHAIVCVIKHTYSRVKLECGRRGKELANTVCAHRKWSWLILSSSCCPHTSVSFINTTFPFCPLHIHNASLIITAPEAGTLFTMHQVAGRPCVALLPHIAVLARGKPGQAEAQARKIDTSTARDG